MIDLSRAPFPITPRELWLPRAINNNATLPSSRYNGHPLTLTGARKGTTTDGVHFNGAVTSLINCGAIHNAAAKMVISFRFKLDQDFNAGDPVQALWQKFWDANNFIVIIFNAGGSLQFQHMNGGGYVFNFAFGPTSWEAGRQYHILASIGQAIGGGAASDGARARVDNGVAVTSADVTPLFNGGDFEIGNYDFSGGLEGCVADFFVMTDDVTAAEETDLFKGIPPLDAVNFWPLDEGRGLGAVAIDRGSGGNNGTLGTPCTWAYGECKHPVLSLDCINDVAAAGGVDISGDLTLVWVGKLKSNYATLAVRHRQFYARIDDNNYISIYHYYGDDGLRWETRVGGTILSGIIPNTGWNIDDYKIIIGTLRQTATQMQAFLDGSLVFTTPNTGSLPGAAAIAYLGRHNTGTYYDISKPLMVALLDGAFTEAQALAFSRWLDNILHLGIGI